MTGIIETQKRKLRMQLRETRYVELNLHLSAGSLEENGLFLGENLNSSFMRVCKAPVGKVYHTEQMGTHVCM